MDSPLLARVAAAGVAGAGEPTAARLTAARARAVDVVIANGAECQPLCFADRTVMAHRAGAVVRGLLVALEASGAARGILAINRSFTAARQALAAAASRCPQLSLAEIDDTFPAGEEQVLTYEVLGRLVPAGGSAIAAGVLVLGIPTLVALAEAAAGQPYIRRWVSVAGAVRRPVVLEVPLGTALADLVSLAGGAAPDTVWIAGGPMLGRPAAPGDVVTKALGSVVVLPFGHPLAQRHRRSLETDVGLSRSVCNACGDCTDGCPAYLLGSGVEPHRLVQGVLAGKAWEQPITAAALCMGCNLCSLYLCPMDLSPARLVGEVRLALADRGVLPRSLLRRNPVHPLRSGRRVPVARLTARLGLAPYAARQPEVADRLQPGRVVLSLMLGGATALRPVVAPGQQVAAGDLVAGAGPGQVPVHASIAGLVTATAGAVVIEAC